MVCVAWFGVFYTVGRVFGGMSSGFARFVCLSGVGIANKARQSIGCENAQFLEFIIIFQ